MRPPPVIPALLASLAIASGTAQGQSAGDQTGRIKGTVVDSISHQPIKKSSISVDPTVFVNGQPVGGAQNATTDSAGSFAFSGLAPGKYQIVVINQNYPQSLMGGTRKTVEVSAGDTAATVTIELMPGAAISGRIVDEDGDPLNGCFVQPRYAKNFNQGIPMMRAPVTHDDGSYRISGIPAGKYIISVQCSTPVFEPRPLSAGPDPPPSMAYPVQYYSAASDAKSAQAVELSAGAEKSGVDFQMRPVGVTLIHGTFAGGAILPGVGTSVTLEPVDASGARPFGPFRNGAELNADGSFDIRSVFPGAYEIVAVSQPGDGQPSDAAGAVGGVLRVDVTDKPLNVSVQLHASMDVSGKIEIEGDTTQLKMAIGQINLQLVPNFPIGSGGRATQPNQDGSFTFKWILPGEYRINVLAPRVFLKSARMGGDDFTNKTLNLTSGAAGFLELVISTNTGTIQGTAPTGQTVFAQAIVDDSPLPSWRGAQVDQNGQFKMEGLAPGKYRVVAGEPSASMPDGGQEVTVAEGETATVELKAEEQP